MPPSKRVLVISILGDDEVLPEGLYDGSPHGTNDLEWIERRLRRAGLEHNARLELVDISQGDSLPAPAGIDAVVMGGSIHNANEGRGWQLEGMDWLRRWRATGRPLLGICGGHQLATVALGGTVETMASGPVASTESIELTAAGECHALFAGCERPPRVHLGHYDYVHAPPAGAEVLARRGDVIMALDMGGSWWTVQFHPEASARVMELGWGDTLGPLNGAYRDTPDGQRIVTNFFIGTGLAPMLHQTDTGT